MRKVLNVFLCWLLLASTAHAQNIIGGGISGDAKASGGGGSATWTAVANPAAQAGTGNPQTISGVSIGTAASNRVDVFCLGESYGAPVRGMNAVTSTTTATGSWTTSSGSITVATGQSISPGQVVYDTTVTAANRYMGLVSTYNSGTGVVTLTANALHASSGSSDAVKFYSAGIPASGTLAASTTASGSWTTASTTITVATGLSISAGYVVYDPDLVNGGSVIGMVSAYVSGTGVITITGTAIAASAGTADRVLIYSTYGVVVGQFVANGSFTVASTTVAITAPTAQTANAGQVLYDVTTSSIVGLISSYTSPTITLKGTSSINSSGSTDTLQVREVGTGQTNIAGTSMFYASIPNGTTATINANSSTTFPGEFGVLVGTINTATPAPGTASSEYPDATRNDPQTPLSAITVASGGVGVDCFMSNNVAALTWASPWTQDYLIPATNFQLALGHTTSSGSQTPSITGEPFFVNSQIVAPWAP